MAERSQPFISEFASKRPTSRQIFDARTNYDTSPDWDTQVLANAAGHPTGGAIDITIIDASKKMLDFGSPLYNFPSEDCYTFAKNISKVGKKNRLLLREIMMSVNFAPYDAEWWHFSYGDREWAFYYKQKNALYNQLTLEDFKKSVI